jgi:hypothetical protein
VRRIRAKRLSHVKKMAALADLFPKAISVDVWGLTGGPTFALTSRKDLRRAAGVTGEQ